jgi:hypothetical protein
VGYPRCKQTGYLRPRKNVSRTEKSKEPSAGESSRLPPLGAGYSASLNKKINYLFGKIINYLLKG